MVIGREAVVDNDVTFVVDVAVMEEINGAFLRTAVLVVAPPAEEEQDDEPEVPAERGDPVGRERYENAG